MSQTKAAVLQTIDQQSITGTGTSTPWNLPTRLSPFLFSFFLFSFLGLQILPTEVSIVPFPPKQESFIYSSVLGCLVFFGRGIIFSKIWEAKLYHILTSNPNGYQFWNLKSKFVLCTHYGVPEAAFEMDRWRGRTQNKQESPLPLFCPTHSACLC